MNATIDTDSDVNNGRNVELLCTGSRDVRIHCCVVGPNPAVSSKACELASKKALSTKNNYALTGLFCKYHA
jgi:hypothetical protein